MSAASLPTTPGEQRALERFYFHEARLLDNRQFRQWLALLSEDVTYRMPARTNVQVDNRDRGNESMLSVERELEDAGGMGNPLRDENRLHLTLRVERAYQINSWAEQPPARTRRLVGNVELMSRAGEELLVFSNFHLHYARPGAGNFLYSGQRRDRLRPAGEAYCILARETVLDYDRIDKPTLGLFF